jgi:4-hydroxybutyrate CoA-transferase
VSKSLISSKNLVSSDIAAKLVKSGDNIIFPGSGCVPWGYLRALFRRVDELRDVSLCYPTAWGEFPYDKEEFKGRFRNKSFFLSANTRSAWKRKMGINVIPVRLSSISALIGNTLPIDVAVFHLSPPDEQGYCSMGPYSVYMNNVTVSAKVKIAQINTHVPRTFGDTKIHINELDFLFEHNEQLLGVSNPVISDIEEKIAKNIEPLINDGDTLQIGRGGVPSAVVQLLKSKNDLGVHSELISDWIIDLVEGGVITGKKKTLLPGILVGTIGDGSQKFYDFVDNNPMIHFKSANFVNDPRIIAMNDNLVSINSAVQIDLTGQINAESVGTRLISGVGGQLDFAIGTDWSKNGRYIVAMPSTALNGAESKIVTTFPKGTAVTVPRSLADIIVTEYGVAYLKGKTLDERVEQLISIAHPLFREQLRKEAEQQLYLQD